MPTILQINVVANWGSTGRIAEQLGKAVIKEGWSSYIAYGRYDAKSESNLVRIGSSFESRIHYHLSKITDRHGLFSSLATWRFIRKVKAIKPDIVHLHNIHGSYLNYRLLFKYLKKSDIPVVWTFHDCWPITGHCTHFVSADCQKWQTQCHHCPLLGVYPRAKVDNSRSNYRLKKKVFTSLQDKLNIVSVSQWLADTVAQSFFIESDVRQHMIYNGVDTSVFSPQLSATKAQLGLPDKKILIAVASSWTLQKGLKDLFELSTMFPDGYQLVIIGLHPKQIEELPSNIIGLPCIDSVEQLARYYSVADVVLNLSRAETFGLTTVEGLSCGTPSIVYNATASPELVRGEKVGRIIEQRDLPGVVNAVEELCAENREEMRKRCREYAVAHFDKDMNYKRYIDLYKQLLNK